MPEFCGTPYKYRFDIICICPNPKSSRVIVGITFFRNESSLKTFEAQESVQNAQNKLSLCPPNCLYSCDLKNLAISTPEEILQVINPYPLKPSE